MHVQCGRRCPCLLTQLLSVAVSDLVYLEKAVALVLGFVGVKLGCEVEGLEVSSAASLSLILATLGGGVVLSKLAEAEEDAQPPHRDASPPASQ